MTDYISREAIMSRFADHVRRSNNSDFAQTPTWNQAVQIVEDIPAADVALVRHGRWVELEDGDCKCSLCGCYHHAWEAHGYYCQHCGARMDGAEPPKEET